MTIRIPTVLNPPNPVGHWGAGKTPLPLFQGGFTQEG